MMRLIQGLVSIAGVAGGLAAGTRRTQLFPTAETSPWQAPLTGREWERRVEDNRETLLVANSPELVTTPGLLFSGTLHGRGSLYFYYVNGLRQNMNLVIYAYSQRDTVLGFQREIVEGPSLDYYDLGRKLSRRELVEYPQPRVLKVQAYRPTPLYPRETWELKPGELLTGRLDVEALQGVELRVLLLPKRRAAWKWLGFWPAVARDGDQTRGTFPATERVVTAAVYDPNHDGIVALTCGDGEQDARLQGKDEVTGESIAHPGNYGLRYRLRIPTRGEGRYRLYFNPRGGGYAGDAAVYHHGVRELVALCKPKGEPALGTGTLQDTVHVGTYSAGMDLEIEWIPAGASYLPVKWWLVPEHLAAENEKKDLSED